MDASTLRLVEEAVANRSRTPVASSIGGALFPRLAGARTLEDAEQIIHDAGRTLAWLGDAIVSEPQGEQTVRGALARVVLPMLALQDELERAVGAAAGAGAARKAIVAHETLRRFFAAWLEAPRRDPRLADPAAVAGAPSREYVRGIALRLALLVVVLEHLTAGGSALIAPLADKAFETSQTLRGAVRELGIDLTPWLDAPAATRVRRIADAARDFWDTLDDEQRRAVGEAWGERVELPPQWPPPPS